MSANNGMTPDNNDRENLEKFYEMLDQWGVTIPSELEPLSIDRLILDWCKAKFPRPQDAFLALRQGNKIEEAAAALFGYCYAEMEPFGWTLEKKRSYILEDTNYGNNEKTIDEKQKEFIRGFIEPLDDLIHFRDEFSSNQVIYTEKEDNQALHSYIDVMIGAARSILFFSGEKKEYEYGIDISLSNLFEIIMHGEIIKAEKFSLRNFVNDGQSISGDVPGFLACLACGVVCESYAQLASNLKKDYERNYESAFSAYIDEIKYLNKTGYTYTLFSQLFEDEENIDQGKIQDPFVNAIGAWEQLKTKPDQIQDWPKLHFYLEELYGFSDDNECGPDRLQDFVYFPKQFSFCEAWLSQAQIHEIVIKHQNDIHKQRFLNDFLVNLWDYLEESTRERLVNAETNWYTTKPPIKMTSTFKDYAVALETELQLILFKKVNPQIARILQNKIEYKNLVYLSSPHAYSLYLSDMANILRYLKENENNKNIDPLFRAIQQAVSSLPVSAESKAFLTQKEFTRDLNDIYLIKNADIHPVFRKELSRVSELRNRILGIGIVGYLANIANIKRELNQGL